MIQPSFLPNFTFTENKSGMGTKIILDRNGEKRKRRRALDRVNRVADQNRDEGRGMETAILYKERGK